MSTPPIPGMIRMAYAKETHASIRCGASYIVSDEYEASDGTQLVDIYVGGDALPRTYRRDRFTLYWASEPYEGEVRL